MRIGPWVRGVVWGVPWRKAKIPKSNRIQSNGSRSSKAEHRADQSNIQYDTYSMSEWVFIAFIINTQLIISHLCQGILWTDLPSGPQTHHRFRSPLVPPKTKEEVQVKSTVQTLNSEMCFFFYSVGWGWNYWIQTNCKINLMQLSQLLFKKK